MQPVKIEPVNNWQDVEVDDIVYCKVKEEISTSVNEKLQNLLDLTLEAKLETKDNDRINFSDPKSFKLEHEGYVGQLISEQNYHHMVSIVKRESFNPEALELVNEMKRKARSQDRFTL